MSEPEITLPQSVEPPTPQKVFDGFDNFMSRVGLANNNTLSASGYTYNLLTRNRQQLEAAYRGSWIVGQVIDTIAQDMTRAGVTITTNEADEDVNDIQSEISKKGVWNSISDLIKWGRLYGGAVAVIQIEGQDLSTPLAVDRVGPGAFLGLNVYDRWQLNPDMTEMIAEGPDAGLPKYYYIVSVVSGQNNGAYATSPSGQVKVHHSRVIRSIGIKLPFYQAITENMWGESVLERLWDRLIAFDNATMSSANLIERANNRTIGIDGLRDIVSAGGKAQEGLEKMFEMMRMLQTNEGITLLDKNDVFQVHNYTFTGLSDMLNSYATQVSGSSEIPIVRLFGQSPSGFNSGEGDIRMYYDTINAKQNATLRSGMDKVIRVAWMSVYGSTAPKDIQFTFVPLWQMSAMDKATIAQTNTNTIVSAYDGLGISRGTALKELRQNSSETGLFTNITDEEVKEAEEEPPPPPEGMLGAPEEREVQEAGQEEEKNDVEAMKAMDSKFKEEHHPRTTDNKPPGRAWWDLRRS